MTPELVGGEPWQQALYRHLLSHADGDGELLADYQKAAEESQSGAFRYLAWLLVEDERDGANTTDRGRLPA